MKRYVPSLLMLIVFSVFPLEAENLEPLVMPSARAAGFGGIHAAQGDDFSAIFSNPASLAGIEKQWSAAEITVSVYGPVFRLLEESIKNSGDISSVIDSEKFATGFDIGGPIAVGLVSNGFGIGFFNRTVFDVKTVSLAPEVFVALPRAWEEFLLIGGYSFRVVDQNKHILDVGVLGKIYYRMASHQKQSFSNLGDWVFNLTDFSHETHLGLGIDLGIKYSYNNIFTIALAGYDVYSPALVTTYEKQVGHEDCSYQSYGIIQPRLALGVLFNIRSDFIVMADYRDFINLFKEDRRHPLFNLSLGMEISLLEILKLRAGMSDLLPSGGFGIDMKFMTLDVAVRGKQLGKDIGENIALAFDVGFLFRY